ncbi:MAG: sugar phosphate isomerase/epimerase [Caldilineaceae bacterium]|nr:sugar phosphate isomerase/epimerase [Caldilineaceae bacterium]
MRSPAWVQLGMNGRFFPGNWRPARQEIAFAQAAGFQSIQFAVRDEALSEAKVGDTFATVAARLADANLTPVMEILIRLDRHGHAPDGTTPIELLTANLPAITTLPCAAVHWHLALREPMTGDEVAALEEALYPQFAAGVALAQTHGFCLGLEHNEPALLLFGTPARCAAALAATPGLHFVWDLNHTTPEHLPAFLALTPRMSMLHVSDTPLPEVNYHFPIGEGTIDFSAYFDALQQRGFTGPAILEIGGQPKSGGFGRDTDAALIQSRQRLLPLLQVQP